MYIGEPRFETLVKARETNFHERAKELKKKGFAQLRTKSNKYKIADLQCGQAGFFKEPEYDSVYLSYLLTAISAYNCKQEVLFVCKRYSNGIDVLRVA